MIYGQVNHGFDEPTSNVVQSGPAEQGNEVKASLEDGFIRIANTLVDALSRTKLSDRESRVLFAVIRRTYGYSKAIDWVCLDQLSEATGISTSNICHAIKSLTNRNILIKDGRKLGVNTTISEWGNKGGKAKKIVNSDNNNIVDSDNAIVEIDNVDCRNREIQKKYNITKDNIKRSSCPNIENSMLDEEENHVVESPKKIRKKWGTEDDLKCAEFIYSKVLAINPTAKQPNWTDWSNQIRLMREQDGRSHHYICKLFKFANMDPFWSTNVLCPSSLRKQWDKLNIKLLASKSNETNAIRVAGHRERYENPTAKTLRKLREFSAKLVQEQAELNDYSDCSE